MGRPRKVAAPVLSETQVPSGDLVKVDSYRDKQLQALLAGVAKAQKVYANNPMWNDAEEFALMSSASYTGRITASEMADAQALLGAQFSPLTNGNININDRFSKRHTVADMNLPRNPEAVITLSTRYALENPFVAKAARVKTDFICSKFQHKTHNHAAKSFYDAWTTNLMVRTQLRKIVWNLVTVGICPVYWGGEDGAPVSFMQVLPPTACRFMDVLGRQKLYLKITAPMVAAVRDPEGKARIENKAQFEAMPQYWIDRIRECLAVGNTMGSIELEDGSYTVIENNYCPQQRNSNTLDGVPLQGAFDALQRYRLMAAGDFAVAWNVKNMLTLISEGDPKATDYTAADDARLMRLAQKFSQPDLALTVYCDPTTKVEYVVPPLEVFNPQKYAQVEKEIKEVLNLPSFMWSNEGSGTYGAATQEMILLRMEMEAIRSILAEQFFMPLYTRLRQNAKRPGFKQTDICLPVFDQNSLHDEVNWLANAGEMYSRGAISLQSYMEINGLDFEYEMAQKQLEHEKYGNTSSGQPGEPLNNSPARPLFEPSQGNLAPNRDKGGNESDGTNAPSSGPRNPRKNGK